MAEIQLTVVAEDSIGETGSAVQVYVNDRLESELTGENREFRACVCIPEETARIALVRRYHDTDARMREECGPVARFFGNSIGFIVAAILAAGLPPDPFEVPYEARETFFLEHITQGAEAFFSCAFDPAGIFPSFQVQTRNCDIRREKKSYAVSEEEITDHYRRRRSFVRTAGLLFTLASLVILLLGAINANLVTVSFGALLLGLSVICPGLALNHLRKTVPVKWEEMKKIAAASASADETKSDLR